MYLPSLVQMVGFGMVEMFIFGGYNIEAFVNMSLRLGSLLNSIICFSLKKVPWSGLLLMIFQLLWIMFLIFGLHGL